MHLFKNKKALDLSAPFAVFIMAVAGVAMLAAAYVCATSGNGVAGALTAAAIIVAASAFAYWIAGAFMPRAIDGPGIYYTGALYQDSAGDLTDSPSSGARNLGANGVVLSADGEARFALVTQCNGQWQATTLGDAVDSGWQHLVKCRQGDHRVPIQQESMDVVGGFLLMPSRKGEIEVVASVNGKPKRLRVKISRAKVCA